MYQYEMNDQYASDFTLIRKEHAIESINDFSSIFVLPKPTAPVSDDLGLCCNQNALFQPFRPFLP